MATRFYFHVLYFITPFEVLVAAEQSFSDLDFNLAGFSLLNRWGDGVSFWVNSWQVDVV